MKERLKKILNEKMTKGKKKGFTLVELLVVIAIIAVLATVSVVGYLGFTSKAKESNDISLTTQMNTVLTAAGAIEKNTTMADAIEDLTDAGIDVEKLTPTSDNYAYVWDSNTDQMLLLNAEKAIVAPSNVTSISDTTVAFTIVHTKAQVTDWASSNYGVYLSSNYNGDYAFTILTSYDVTAKSNVDVSITDANSSETAMVNMDGGNLTLNTPKGTVNHYGETTIVTATAVSTSNSYHEYGTTDNLDLTVGRIVAENGGIIRTVNAVNAQSGSSVTEKTGGTIGTVIIASDSSNVTVDTSIDKKTTDQVTTALKGAGTEASPYLIGSASDFSVLSTGKVSSADDAVTFKESMIAGNKYYFKQTADIVVDEAYTGVYLNGTYDGAKHSIRMGSCEGEHDVLFTMMDSSILNLDVISTPSTLLSIIGPDGEWKYTKALTIDNCNTYVLNDSNEADTVNVTASNLGFFVSGHLFSSKYEMNISITNSNNYGNIESLGTCTGAFIGGSVYMPGYSSTKLGEFEKDSKTYTMSRIDNKYFHKFTMKNCHNYGNVTGNEQAGLIFGNYVGLTRFTSTYYDTDKNSQYVFSEEERATALKNITIENVTNEATINAIDYVGVFPTKESDNTYNAILNDKFESSCTGTSGKFINNGNALANASTFTIQYSAGDFYISGNSVNSLYEYKLGLSVNSVYTSEVSRMDGRTYVLPLTQGSNDSNVTVTTTGNRAYNETEALEANVITEDEVLDYTKHKYQGSLPMAIKVTSDGKVHVIFENGENTYPYTGYPDDSDCGKLTLRIFAYDVSGKYIGYHNFK